MDYFDSHNDNYDEFDDLYFEDDYEDEFDWLSDEDDDDFDDIDTDIEKPRYLFKPISCIKENITEHPMEIGHIRNRIYVNSTFKAIVTWVDENEIPDQSIERCTFINCKFISSIMIHVNIKNSKFINCTFHDTFLDFDLMKNVTFENCTFVNSLYTYDEYTSYVTMENCTFIDINIIVDLEKE